MKLRQKTPGCNIEIIRMPAASVESLLPLGPCQSMNGSLHLDSQHCSKFFGLCFQDFQDSVNFRSAFKAKGPKFSSLDNGYPVSWTTSTSPGYSLAQKGICTPKDLSYSQFNLRNIRPMGQYGSSGILYEIWKHQLLNVKVISTIATASNCNKDSSEFQGNKTGPIKLGTQDTLAHTGNTILGNPKNRTSGNIEIFLGDSSLHGCNSICSIVSHAPKLGELAVNGRAPSPDVQALELHDHGSSQEEHVDPGNSSLGGIQDSLKIPGYPTNNSQGHAGRSKRKRAADDDEDEEDNEDINPAKRVERDGTKSTSRRLACPFAKASPDRYLNCLLINRKDLSGVKEHLKRNHFDKKLPQNIRATRTWEQVFDVCNPQWGSKQRPSPYFDRVALATSWGTGFETGTAQGELLPNYVRVDAGATEAGQPVAQSTSPCLKIESQTPLPAASSPGLHISLNTEAAIYSTPLSHHGTSPMNAGSPHDVESFRRLPQNGVEAASPISISQYSNRASFSIPEDDITPGRPESGLGFTTGVSANSTSWFPIDALPSQEQAPELRLNPTEIPLSDWLSDPVLSGEYAYLLGNHSIEASQSSNSRSFLDLAPSITRTTLSGSSFETPATVNPSKIQYQSYPNAEQQGMVDGSWQTSQLSGHLFAARNANITQNQEAGICPKGLGCPLQMAGESKTESNKASPQAPHGRDRSERKKYRLLVTRRPPDPTSTEPLGSHRFTFQDFDEFLVEFEPWLVREFTSPPFCWQKMEFVNDKKESRLGNIKQIVDDLEESCIHYRSDDFALYLVAKYLPSEGYSPEDLNFVKTV